MDPVSAVASVLSITDVALRTTSALIKYARDTKYATADRELLVEEATTLRVMLEQLQDHAKNPGIGAQWIQTRKGLVQQFQRAYEDFASLMKLDDATRQLKQESRFKALRTKTKWSFTKVEVYSMLERVTRLQQYANALLLNDQQSIVVNHLRRQRTETLGLNIGVAVVYISYNDPEQTLHNLTTSLLKQLVQEQEEVPNRLRELYERHYQQNSTPTPEEISEVTRIIIDAYDNVFFVVDALDECSDEIRWGLLEFLRQFQSSAQIMITSRSLDSIGEELEGFELIEIKAHRSDIELFIDDQIQKNKNLRKVIQKSSTMRADIKKRVVETAQHMFLLARLHVESLASAAALSIRHVRNRLQTLPSSLEATYDEAMQRITAQEPDRQKVALKTLAWISYAFRPLSLKELQHAVAIEPGDRELDEDLIMDGSNITAFCAGLVVVDQRTSVVNLVHYTTEGYFKHVRSTYFPNFHASITMSCATYLTLDDLESATIWNILQNYPLASYAAQYMGDHARENPEDALESSILESICRLLSHPAKRKPLLALLDSLDMIKAGFYSSGKAALDHQLHAITEQADDMHFDSLLDSINDISADASQATSDDLESEITVEEPQSSRVPEVTALHIAASMGLAKVASMLVNERADIDAVDETGKTALALAMERGFEKAVGFLVNSGACVDLTHSHGQAVLLLVTERHWDAVAEIILQKAQASILETKPGSDDDNVRRCHVELMLAAYYGDDQNIIPLVEQVDLKLYPAHSQMGANALFVAVEREHLAVAQALISAGLAVDATDSIGQTSLHRATRRESEALIRLLLHNGAEVDRKDDKGRTAWSANVKHCSEPILRLFIEAGADPCVKGHDGITELYEAAAKGEAEYVKKLLLSGTDPSIATQYDWTPLHWAANNGNINCVQLLIEAGANVSAVSDQGTTPLDMAIGAKQHAIVDILTQAGAKSSQDMKSNDTPTTTTASWRQEPNVVGVDIYDIPQGELNTEDVKPPEKLSLSFDKPLGEALIFGQFIYPSNFHGTRDYFYQISHPVSTRRPSISIRHTKRHADMAEYPIGPDKFFSTGLLYEIVRVSVDYQELELRDSSATPESGTVKMRRGWTGSWKVHHMDPDTKTPELLFRTTPEWSMTDDKGCRWVTTGGQLLAKTTLHLEAPTLTLEPGQDRETQDVLVACWVAMLWSDTVTLQKREG
ncbi:MAG: hypothetical protein Q9207_001998 [Kuettlingeria erythrocarpa]